jgi:hypothetical protein
MGKPDFGNMFRLVNQLEDGRKVYLSLDSKILAMTKEDAQYWVKVGNLTQGVMVDGFVYSQDLRLYGRRSYWLERLEPFVQVERMMIEPVDAPVDPQAFIVGGIPAKDLDYRTKPVDVSQQTFVFLCEMNPSDP